MKFRGMEMRRLLAGGLLALAAFSAGTSAVQAASNTYEDPKRGFSTKYSETMKQVPPKPNGDAPYLAVQFYDDQAKYRSSGSVNPEYNITWWVTKKAAASTPSSGGGGTSAGAAEPDPDETEGRGGRGSFDSVLDWLVSNNPKLFGKDQPPMAELWKSAKAGKTTKQKIDFKYVELNATKPKKKDEPPPHWYLFAAQLTIERPSESILVGFYGTCAVGFAKDLGPEYLSIVRNFATTEASGAKQAEAPTDPAAFHEYIKKTKVIKGWKYMPSPLKQYAMVYDEAVKDDLVKDIGTQIEGIRAQVYEKLFPPDKPVTAVSVIRVCKDKEQYMAYGGSPSSAGYWQWTQGELVFFKDSQNPGDAMRVLYHEAFHQYIFYSVGAMSPHSWFNEGHGDYFAGHDHKGGGRFELGVFAWRKDLAAQLKREKRTVPLKDWLRWDQRRYYGGNDRKLAGTDNYALGWSFVYFLRTTRNASYQGFLERYFAKLKSLVTQAREERRAAREKAKAEGSEPPDEEPEAIANLSKEDEWCEAALAEALKGIDLDQMEKDWLADNP